MALGVSDYVEMSAHVLTAPRWLLGVVVGLPIAVVVGLLVGLLSSGDWFLALLCGAFAGLLIGLLVAHTALTHRQQVRLAVGELPLETLVPAYRASQGGPVPADPATRATALKIATHQLNLLGGNSSGILIPFCLMPALLVFITDTDRPAAYVAIPALLGVLATALLSYQLLYVPRQLRKRVDLLSAATPVD